MNQIKVGAFLNYIIIFLNTLVGLLYTPYMLRCLGQNEYGLYSLVASIIAYLTLLDFGFGNAIVRYTAKFRAEKKTTEQWEMFGMFLIVYTIIGLLAFTIGLGLYYNVDRLFDKTMSVDELSQARLMIMLLIVNLAVTFPLSMFGSIITAYENFSFQKIVSILRILLTTAVLILLLHFGYKAVALVVVQTVFNIGTLLLNYLYCRYKLRIKILFARINAMFIKEIAIFSFWLFLNGIMDRVYWSTGQFVLGATIGTAAVGIYSIAILLQTMYMQFSTSISNVLLPKITAMVARNNTEKEISDIFIRTGRIQYLVMALILSGFIVFGRQFINIWAGAEYAPAYIITLLFFVSLLIPLIQNTGITILQARNQLKFRSLLYLAIALVSLIFQIVLAKKFGALGCAIAIAGALMLGQGLIMNIYYYSKQKINIPEFWKEILQMSLIPVSMCIMGLFLTDVVSQNSVSVMVFEIMLFAIIYMTLTYRFSMNTYEREIVLSPVRKISARISGKMR